jgi:hypothetical protein
MTEGKNKLHRRDGSRIPLSTRFPHVIYHLLYTDVDLFWEDGTRASVSEIKNHPPLRMVVREASEQGIRLTLALLGWYTGITTTNAICPSPFSPKAKFACRRRAVLYCTPSS